MNIYEVIAILTVTTMFSILFFMDMYQDWHLRGKRWEFIAHAHAHEYAQFMRLGGKKCIEYTDGIYIKDRWIK